MPNAAKIAKGHFNSIRFSVGGLRVKGEGGGGEMEMP